jgi:hypothetical protein
MPRATPCRALKVLALPWIVMIGMWLFLPSPVVQLQQREAYIQNRISASKTVITALNYKPFKKDAYSIYSGECGECDDLLIHWQLIKSGHSLLLASSYYKNSNVNITKVLYDAEKWNAEEWEVNEKWVPYYSEPLAMDGVPAGSTDEEINMPWFQMTDQKLMHYNMHNFEVSITARAIVPIPGVLEIWRSAYVESFLYDLNSTDQEQATYKKIRANKSEPDFLASFQLVSDRHTPRVIVNHLAGELPSRTYPIRKAILFFLAPVYSILFMPVMMLFDPESPFFYVIVVCLSLFVSLVCYRRIRQGETIISCCGRLCWPLQFIKRRQRKNRTGKRGLWGPTGPVDKKTHRSWFDEEKMMGLQRSDNVRMGSNWKASSSRTYK